MSHPEKIGKYPIVRTLGEGAMGVVYEAFDPIIRRPLAIKTIRRALIESEQSGAAAVAPGLRILRAIQPNRELR